MRGVPSPAPLVPLGGSPPYRRRGARCALLLVRDDRGDLGTSRPEASSWRRPPTEARDLDHAQGSRVRGRLHLTRSRWSEEAGSRHEMGVRARHHPRRDVRRIYGGLPGMRTCARCRVEYQASKRCTESRGCFCSAACMEAARHKAPRKSGGGAGAGAIHRGAGAGGSCEPMKRARPPAERGVRTVHASAPLRWTSSPEHSSGASSVLGRSSHSGLVRGHERPVRPLGRVGARSYAHSPRYAHSPHVGPERPVER